MVPLIIKYQHNGVMVPLIIKYQHQQNGVMVPLIIKYPINYEVSTEWGYGPINNQVST